MIKNIKVELGNLLLSLSDALDLSNPQITDHQQRVSYISLSIADEMKVDAGYKQDLFLASLFHDVGIFSTDEKLKAKEFDLQDPKEHWIRGYFLLRDIPLFRNASGIIRFHHLPWNNGQGIECDAKEVPLQSHIVHLADRIEILINRDEPILNQCNKIKDIIKSYTGNLFHPRHVDIFLQLATKEHFWLDLTSSRIYSILLQMETWVRSILELEDLGDISSIFSHIIDFKSHFTATHSARVAASSSMLARFMRFSDRECRMMEIAGFLHDLGKLSVPNSILEKQGKLDETEFNIIRAHTYHTFHLLNTIGGMKTIAEWASFHHERLDGRGYPFHHDASVLSLGSRIMSISDVFTALAEDRPYRKGLEKEAVIRIMDRMVQDGALDADVFKALKNNYDNIIDRMIDAQKHAEEAYQKSMGDQRL
ncbi:MAG: HD-GYP domain-containing protein [Nitrospinota bacterium]